MHVYYIAVGEILSTEGRECLIPGTHPVLYRACQIGKQCGLNMPCLKNVLHIALSVKHTNNWLEQRYRNGCTSRCLTDSDFTRRQFIYEKAAVNIGLDVMISHSGLNPFTSSFISWHKKGSHLFWWSISRCSFGVVYHYLLSIGKIKKKNRNSKIKRFFYQEKVVMSHS